MRLPRNLDTSLPSPSEIDNFHRCPCLWFLRDRMWVKPAKARFPLVMGSLVDHALDSYMREEVAATGVVGKFDEAAQDFALKHLSYEDLDEWGPLLASTRDALKAYLMKYQKQPDLETVIAVQPAFTGASKVKIDYIVRLNDGRIRIRERKVISPFAEIEDEIAKYEMGFQPMAYMAETKRHLTLTEGDWIECVEFEFLFRSSAGTKKYKPIPAEAERRCVYVDDWKLALWEHTAVWTNEIMVGLEGRLKEEFAFEEVPRFTRNCIQKFGRKNYPCEFYGACSTNTSPLSMPEQFTCDLEGGPDGGDLAVNERGTSEGNNLSNGGTGSRQDPPSV